MLARYQMSTTVKRMWRDTSKNVFGCGRGCWREAGRIARERWWLVIDNITLSCVILKDIISGALPRTVRDRKNLFHSDS